MDVDGHSRQSLHGLFRFGGGPLLLFSRCGFCIRHGLQCLMVVRDYLSPVASLWIEVVSAWVTYYYHRDALMQFCKECR